jgi:Ca-activated chloride channel homolog
MRGVLGIACVVVLGATLTATQEPSPGFVSGSAELVVLPVTVTDRRGAFVGSLPRDRFAVFDNGRPQDVAFFSNEDTPVSIGLIIDSSGSMRPKLPDVVAATLELARLSNPHDELFMVPFNDVVLGRARQEPALAANLSALESDLRSLVPEGRTALYDALTVGLERVEQGTKPRKALIVMSDGGDNASRTRLDAVLARARRSNVVIFTIGLFEDDDLDRNPGALQSLARSTGGERFLPRSGQQIADACERIARDLRSGYTIGYVPPDRDGSFHRVLVKIGWSPSEKLTIRTRPGYFAAAPAGGLP